MPSPDSLLEGKVFDLWVHEPSGPARHLRIPASLAEKLKTAPRQATEQELADVYALLMGDSLEKMKFKEAPRDFMADDTLDLSDVLPGDEPA